MVYGEPYGFDDDLAGFVRYDSARDEHLSLNVFVNYIDYGYAKHADRANYGHGHCPAVTSSATFDAVTLRLRHDSD